MTKNRNFSLNAENICAVADNAYTSWRSALFAGFTA